MGGGEGRRSLIFLVVSVLSLFWRGGGEEGKGGGGFMRVYKRPVERYTNNCEPGRVPRSIGVLCMRADVL